MLRFRELRVKSRCNGFKGLVAFFDGPPQEAKVRSGFRFGPKLWFRVPQKHRALAQEWLKALLREHP